MPSASLSEHTTLKHLPSSLSAASTSLLGSAAGGKSEGVQRMVSAEAAKRTSAEASTSGTHRYDGMTFVSHMVAGSVAGTVEHTAMFPVDTIKTRMQALYHHPGHAGSAVAPSVRQAVVNTIRSDGIGGLYRGVWAVAAGAGPAHAMHFAVYEYVKDLLGGNKEGLHPVETALAGCSATVVNDALMTPFDCVKQRLQVEGSPYKGVGDALRRIIRTEGVGALYRSYRTTLIMNVPFTAMHFSVYETAKKLLIGDDEKAEETLQTQLIAGGLAGGAAAAITTPLDVVKTRLQLAGLQHHQHHGGHHHQHHHSVSSTTAAVASAAASTSGAAGTTCAAGAESGAAAAAAQASSAYQQGDAVLPMLRKILRDEGMAGLWAGLRPRVLFHIPSAAVCWGTYETMKTLLSAR